MKYFKPELSRAAWDNACKNYYKAYKKIEKHFPHEFSETFLNGDFHDACIMRMDFHNTKNDEIDLDMHLHNFWNGDADHYIKLKNITNVKMNITLFPEWFSEWISTEILPIKNQKYVKGRRFSLEVTFSSDNYSDNRYLYIEFGSIEYSQEKK